MTTNGIKRTYYITTDLEEGLRKLAYVRKATLSSIVREAIGQYITLASNKAVADLPSTRKVEAHGDVEAHCGRTSERLGVPPSATEGEPSAVRSNGKAKHLHHRVEKFCEIINEAFGHPFMPKGFVQASPSPYPNGIRLGIGSRDLSFTLDGEWNGQGTDLPDEWTIEKAGRRESGKARWSAQA